MALLLTEPLSACSSRGKSRGARDDNLENILPLKEAGFAALMSIFLQNIGEHVHIWVCEVNCIIARGCHDKPVLCIDEAFFIPYTLMSSILPATSREALWRYRLSWGQTEVEEMVQRLTRSHLGSALRRQRLTLPLLAGHLSTFSSTIVFSFLRRC